MTINICGLTGFVSIEICVFAVGFIIVLAGLYALRTNAWLNALILAKKFPDRPEKPDFIFEWQFGSVGFNLVWPMTLSLCQSGLRVSVPGALGWSNVIFFVPWELITVSRSATPIGQRVELRFTDSRLPLLLTSNVANKLRDMFSSRWPEKTPAPEMARFRFGIDFLIIWFLGAMLGAGVFKMTLSKYHEDMATTLVILLGATSSIVFSLPFYWQFIGVGRRRRL
ncbi:MAG: hypothetical protein JWQ35_1393 [Bacteriovoracaceae bacterium]|nr:hypothetical protein [Bacteriovoracaceae bacterium]